MALSDKTGMRHQDLANEVRCWIADEPVSVYRGSFTDRGRRWARRHRTTVSSLAAAVLAGIVVLSVAAVQIRLAYKESEKQRRQAEAALDFLKNDVLAAARPEGQEGGLGVQVTLRQAIDAAEPKIATAFKDHPLGEAEIRDALGRTYLFLGDAEVAQREFLRAVELNEKNQGLGHPDTLASMQGLATSYFQAVGDNGVEARYDNGELHAGGGEIAFESRRLAFNGIGPGPKTEAEAGFGLDREQARAPVRFSDRRKAGDGPGASLRAQPGFGRLMNGVERRNFDKDVGGGRELAIDKFEIPERSQERCAPRSLFLPPFAGRESQRGKKAGQPVVRCRAARRTQKRDALNHESILSCGGPAVARSAMLQKTVL